jgi:hypothetical protein
MQTSVFFTSQQNGVYKSSEEFYTDLIGYFLLLL